MTSLYEVTKVFRKGPRGCWQTKPCLNIYTSTYSKRALCLKIVTAAPALPRFSLTSLLKSNSTRGFISKDWRAVKDTCPFSNCDCVLHCNGVLIRKNNRNRETEWGEWQEIKWVNEKTLEANAAIKKQIRGHQDWLQEVMLYVGECNNIIFQLQFWCAGD